jgi:hypothetical protein
VNREIQVGLWDRVRYRLRSAPVQLAQQFLAALAHEWDDRLEALQHHLTGSWPSAGSR